MSVAVSGGAAHLAASAGENVIDSDDVLAVASSNASEHRRVSCCSPAAASAGCQNEKLVDFCEKGEMMQDYEESEMLN